MLLWLLEFLRWSRSYASLLHECKLGSSSPLFLPLSYHWVKPPELAMRWVLPEPSFFLRAEAREI